MSDFPIVHRVKGRFMELPRDHVNAFIVEMEERKASDIVFNNHRGEEFLYVLRGSVEFCYGDDSVILEEGDSLYFDSIVPHGYRGIGGSAKTLVVIYRPQ